MNVLTKQVPNLQKDSLLEVFEHGSYRCIPGISNEQYHADRSCISTSNIKALIKSPAHFKWSLNHPQHPTDAMLLGSAVHKRLLEPEDFYNEYVLPPEGIDKRSKDWRTFMSNTFPKKIIEPGQLKIIESIAASVRTHQTATALLDAAQVEHTLIWQDEETGIWIKIRPDALNLALGGKVCIDIKKCPSADHDSFLRACFRYDYDLQAGIYTEGLEKAFGESFDFVFLVVEEEAPFNRQLLAAPPHMIKRGRRRFHDALRTLKTCRETGNWPGYQPKGDYAVLEWPSNAN